MVVISGYRSPLYDELLSGWSRADTTARISAHRGTSVRDEHIWLNPACAAQLHGTGLLSAAACSASTTLSEPASAQPRQTPPIHSRHSTGRRDPTTRHTT